MFYLFIQSHNNNKDLITNDCVRINDISTSAAIRCKQWPKQDIRPSKVLKTWLRHQQLFVIWMMEQARTSVIWCTELTKKTLRISRFYISIWRLEILNRFVFFSNNPVVLAILHKIIDSVRSIIFFTHWTFFIRNWLLTILFFSNNIDHIVN